MTHSLPRLSPWAAFTSPLPGLSDAQNESSADLFCKVRSSSVFDQEAAAFGKPDCAACQKRAT